MGARVLRCAAGAKVALQRTMVVIDGISTSEADGSQWPAPR
eukprot:CAMPEP_0202911022 /NCGR_PEP_ID=MMETSP1392-20130828/53792_1 /ASSEMBLY_ACC=CAM_ASM_000868 /TAXON_ID=225041 /ORGANISM="Chlamydomonas chlamydogama, Strain SAG 11-48b" /LENGTH=40 /DNA_ID= /DNA_START= /DNA_END= /DNA_ORIENTATION=